MLVADASVEDIDSDAATGAHATHRAVEARLTLRDSIERARPRAQRGAVGEIGQRSTGQDEALRGVESRGAAREGAGRRGDDNNRREASSDMRQDALLC